MVKPVIMTLDDEPVVLKAVGRDLQSRYQRDYQIIEAGSGNKALEIILKLKQRNQPVALFLVDQRMPDMSGTEFLARAMKFYPNSKKVMLTAYSDTEAAIQSINEIGLDFYMLKPWDPPEVKLYPLLDELLRDWMAEMQVPYDGIRVIGATWSARSLAAKDVLNHNQVPYQWLDAETDHVAKVLIESGEHSKDRLPLVFFPDGSLLVDPDSRQLTVKASIDTQQSVPFFDLIIVGGGAAGLGAVASGGLAGLKTLLIEKGDLGGQAGTDMLMDNYLAFPVEISGIEFVGKSEIHARKLGVEIMTGHNANKVYADGPYRFITLDDGRRLSCHSLLVTTGVKTNRLTQPGIEELSGLGVYYDASLADAIAYKDQDVFIIGGDDSSGRAALLFARYASKVTILSSSSSLSEKMSSHLVSQISRHDDIQVFVDTKIDMVNGAGQLESITFTNRINGNTQKKTAAAVFIFTAAEPRSEIVADVVQRDSEGFILTGLDLVEDGKRPPGWKPSRDPFYLEASVPGIFAAGDVRHGSIKRVSAALEEGLLAVQLIKQHLKTV